MAKNHSIRESVPSQHSPQSQLDWQTTRKPSTPKSEYVFMQKYSLICGTQPHGQGPAGACEVAQ